MKYLFDNPKVVFWLSLATLIYFSFLFLNAYLLHLSFVMIGVVQEMVTIPFTLLDVFLFLGWFRL